MNEKGRGWTPQTKLQVLFFSTYTTKKAASINMGVTVTTLRLLFGREDRFTYSQLKQLSKDSDVKLTDIIKLYERSIF